MELYSVTEIVISSSFGTKDGTIKGVFGCRIDALRLARKLFKERENEMSKSVFEYEKSKTTEGPNVQFDIWDSNYDGFTLQVQKHEIEEPKYKSDKNAF